MPIRENKNTNFVNSRKFSPAKITESTVSEWWKIAIQNDIMVRLYNIQEFHVQYTELTLVNVMLTFSSSKSSAPPTPQRIAAHSAGERCNVN